MNATIARLRRLSGDPAAAADGPLLDAFLSGDQSAFAVLVRRHAALVFATCRRVLRHHQDAEDAFQATFLVLARRAADVWPRDAVGAWLFGVAHRVALKARTVRGRRLGPQRPLDEIACPKPAAPDFDLADAVHRVVAKLPEVYRAAVVACDLQGLSRKEAAERLGWSEGTLSGRLSRARELLARRFRRLGLDLPTGGLVAVLTASETVSAGFVKSTIELAIGTGRSGMSAPVAALTEGVVRSMVLFKFKTMSAVVLAACALGLGTFAATGAGDGDGAGQPRPPQTAGPTGAAPPAAPVPPAAVKLVTDRERFQGTWRVVAVASGGKTHATNPKEPLLFEFSGDTLRIKSHGSRSGSTGTTSARRGTAGGTTGGASSSSTSGSESAGPTPPGEKNPPIVSEREWAITFGPAKPRPDGVRWIDLKAPLDQYVKGVYEFTAPVGTCSACHGPNKAPALPLIGNVQDFEQLGLCAPGLASIPSDGAFGLRLALSRLEDRPTKFGGDGAIVYELLRQDPQEGIRAQLERKYELYTELMKSSTDVEERARLKAELDRVAQRLVDLNQLAAVRRERPELRTAEELLEVARAEAARTQANMDRAQAAHSAAKDRVAAAEREVAELKKPKPAAGAAPDGPAITVRIRPLKAAEKVVRVKASGNETVLDVLATAADDGLLTSGGVSAWVVRDNEVFEVDLPGITKKGQSSTNYVLKAGDQLFVQAKPGK